MANYSPNSQRLDEQQGRFIDPITGCFPTDNPVLWQGSFYELSTLQRAIDVAGSTEYFNEMEEDGITVRRLLYSRDGYMPNPGPQNGGPRVIQRSDLETAMNRPIAPGLFGQIRRAEIEYNAREPRRTAFNRYLAQNNPREVETQQILNRRLRQRLDFLANESEEDRRAREAREAQEAEQRRNEELRRLAFLEHNNNPVEQRHYDAKNSIA
jgi:hypothetical protein